MYLHKHGYIPKVEYKVLNGDKSTESAFRLFWYGQDHEREHFHLP